MIRSILSSLNLEDSFHTAAFMNCSSLPSRACPHVVKIRRCYNFPECLPLLPLREGTCSHLHPRTTILSLQQFLTASLPLCPPCPFILFLLPFVFFLFLPLYFFPPPCLPESSTVLFSSPGLVVGRGGDLKLIQTFWGKDLGSDLRNSHNTISNE